MWYGYWIYESKKIRQDRQDTPQGRILYILSKSQESVGTLKSTRENRSGTKYNFLLIGHEKLYVFRKLKGGESKAKFKNSMKWC